MTDLAAFIEARLAEDEAIALAASCPYKYAASGATTPPDGVHWTWVVGENWTPVVPDPVVDDTVGGPENYGCPVNLVSVEEWPTESGRQMPRAAANQMVEVDSSAALHLARHDPARVLREVEAKRKILAWCRAMDPPHGLGGILAGEARLILRWLAEPWSDHPDYQAGWPAE